MLFLEVEQYDELYKEVLMKYPNTPEETLHEITMTIYKKIQNDRQQYIKSYKQSEGKHSNKEDEIAKLNKNFNDFVQETRSYRTWTTRYRGPSI